MTDTTTNEKRESVAKHELLLADGSVTDDIQVATGIRYTDRATDKTFDYQIPDNKGRLMLALFGAKTKATNVTSRVRQKNGKVGDAERELEALDEVFESITNEVWREEAVGGGGSRTDKSLLAEVVVQMLGTGAKGDTAFYLTKFENDKEYLKKVMASDAGDEYKKRRDAGKVKVAIADLA